MQLLCKTAVSLQDERVARVDGVGVWINCKEDRFILGMCVVWETLPLPMVEHGNFSN